MIPSFDEAGNLPSGHYSAGIQEIIERFGVGSPEREAQAEELMEFLAWAGEAGVRRIVLDGSFVSDRTEPNDVDLVILPGADYPGNQAPASEMVWPYLHVMVSVDDEDLDSWIQDVFATDRLGRAKGVVEVIL